jgi:hypothetical protein
MKFGPESRVMSLSFVRDPKEHAQVMLEAGRRFTTPVGPRYHWQTLLGAAGIGVLIALAMELYRSFFLIPVLEIANVPPLDVVLAQFLPFLLLIFLVYFGRARYLQGRHRKALEDRVSASAFVDVDIFEGGIASTVERMQVSMEWAGVRNVYVSDQRIEFECDVFVLYIPARAFADKPTFEKACQDIYTLWRQARLEAVSDAEKAAIEHFENATEES